MTPIDDFDFEDDLTDLEMSLSDEIDIEYVKDYIEAVLECVYDTGNVRMLDSHLEELCQHLDIQHKRGELMLTSLNNRQKEM